MREGGRRGKGGRPKDPPLSYYPFDPRPLLPPKDCPISSPISGPISGPISDPISDPKRFIFTIP